MKEKTPPNSTNPEAIDIKSTPFSKGTASVAEFNNNLQANASHNITNLAEDLKKKRTTTIIPFLRTLICRILLERKRKEPGRASGKVELEEHEEISKVGEDIFNQILAKAVDFCNSKENQTIEMKNELRRYCNVSLEKDRYLPLSTALNKILWKFRDEKFGDIPPPNSHEDKEEIIFTPFDPQALKGNYQHDTTKNKPDICAAFLSRLCQIDDTCQDFTFEAMATSIAKGERKKEEDKIKWIDVQQPWELKRSKSKLEFIEKIWNVDEIIRENQPTSPHPTQSTPPPPPPPPPQPTQPPPRQGPKKQSSRKRPLDDKSVHSSKRSRTSENPRQSLLGSTAKGKKDVDGETKGSNQYARYALERASAGWYLTCSSVALLHDTSLSLHWFDAEGCLESKPFHIFEQLPLFVSMVVIIQRFTPDNWGMSQRDKNKVTVSGREFLLKDNDEKLYQLHGRRTYVAFASDPPVAPVTEDSRPPQGIPADRIPRHRYSTRKRATAPATGGEAEGTTPTLNTEPHDDPPVAEPAATNATEDEAPVNVDGQSPPPESTFPYCFKQADVEDKRDPEFVIAKEALARALARLPEKYRAMVEQHMPDIIVGEKREDLTTADIRLHAKLAGGLPDVSEKEIMDKARVRIWMVSRTLKGVLELSPSQFWEVFWDIMRCLYLLWRIGIAHGDISLANMMYKEVKGELKGILNDFDLAAVMDAEERSPEKKGWERTGTLPYMALDLLRFYDGQIKRWFRHDLESGAWCLAWQMLDEESEHRDWYTGTFKSIYKHKRELLSSIKLRMVKKDWQDYFDFIDNWLSEWSKTHHEIDLRVKKLSMTEEFEEREKYDEEHPDEEFIRTAVDLARKYGLDNVDALKDTSWIGVQLLPDPPKPK